jgi:hypothetical protein
LDRDANANGGSVADCDPDANADSDPYTDGNCRSVANCHPDANADSDPYTDGNCRSVANCDTNADAHTHGDFQQADAGLADADSGTVSLCELAVRRTEADAPPGSLGPGQRSLPAVAEVSLPPRRSDSSARTYEEGKRRFRCLCFSATRRRRS